jgi:hypothetical protein
MLAFLFNFGSLHAALQFDVFLGFDGIVPEASWFPVVCEVKNDGPTFTGTVELTSGNQNQTRRVTVELPTGTLKRFVLPMFSTTAQGYTRWDVRLYDERGRVRAEQPGLSARKQIAAETPLIGALARTAVGTPVIRPIAQPQSIFQPVSARLLTSLFPDNPLVLEGLHVLYLNSEKALDLTKEGQINALYGWVNAGGHLVVAVEQVSDIASTPWLRSLFPCDVKDIKTLSHHTEFQDWLREPSWRSNPNFDINQQRLPQGRQYGKTRPAPKPDTRANNPFSDLEADSDFEKADMQVASGKLKEGAQVIVAGNDMPLIVTANHGRGRVTALMFSPEREPFRSWKNLPTFWAKLAEVPGEWYLSADINQQMRPSSDGIFGSMIETNQVHKLPIEWLLLLLIVYLVVIGPLDQFWLKRIGRPMLTWITFPCYVILFSLLIYFIGYKLRAGESEWNEVHLVDVLENGERAELRGRTYASVYSPANQRYILESLQKYATLRGEFVGAWGGGQSSEKATVVQNGDSFKAEIFVPVWTSQLFVSDWWQSASKPLGVTVIPKEGGWQVTMENRSDRKLTNARLVVAGFVMPLGSLAPKETRTVTVSTGQGTSLRDFVSKHGQNFHGAINSRQQAFGQTERVNDPQNATVAACFISQVGATSDNYSYMGNFIAPPGLDLSSVVERGEAVVLAWAEDYSPIKPMYQFSPRRSHTDTLWRVAVEVKPKT